MADKGIILLLLVTFSLTCCCQASTTYIQLRQGDKLNFSDRLVSRNGDFALGFSGSYLVINSTYSDDHPVWSANRDKPIVENSGVLTLDDVGNLKIIYSGGEIELYSGKSASTGNLTAVLEDNGNFVLKENSGNRVWESFDNPADTLLPGMKLGFNYKRNRTWSLTSWTGEENPKPGEFSMEWDYRNAQIVVKRQGGIFWRSRKLNSDNPLANMLLPNPLNNFQFNIVSNDGEEESVSFQVYFDKLSPIQLRIFSRWFLKYNGDIFLAGRGWPDILTTSMSCNQNRTESECVNRELPNSKCRNDGSRIELRTGDFGWHTSVHTYTVVDNKNLSFTDCRDLCWKNCSCVGFQKMDETLCALYQGSFYIKDLQSDDFTNSPSYFGYRGRNRNQYYLIIPGAPPPGSPPSMIWKWIVITLGIAVFTGIVSLFLLLKWKKLKQEEKFLRELLICDRPNGIDELQNDGNQGHNLQLYSIRSIKTASNSFSLQNKLGEGGFGPVYKGKLAGGQEIAVKRLSAKSGQGLVEFKNELIIIAKLQHLNLVRLLGFCIQEQERLLIYEYLPNKSLDSFIFDQSKKELLDWSKRYNIIDGIAQGLTYLHKYSRLRIIHRDLKASNILLDKDMVPKISDFGMARFLKRTESATNTNRIVGTYGYMSPEYAMEGIFSEKSDVYSFGVLMLEIISGKRNHNTYHDERPLNLVGYTWEQWKGNRAEETVDKEMSYVAPKDEVMRCINVALLCVEQDPMDRPSMPQVLCMLSNEEQLPMPKQPAFYIRQSSSNQESVPDCSANGFSFTTMVAR